jgi:hypothetical protein
VILADEIVILSREHDAGNRRSPVLPSCLRVLSLAVNTIAVLPNGTLEIEAAVCVHRERGTRHD